MKPSHIGSPGCRHAVWEGDFEVMYEWRPVDAQPRFDVQMNNNCAAPIATDITREDAAQLIGLLLRSPQYHVAYLTAKLPAGDWIEVGREPKPEVPKRPY